MADSTDIERGLAILAGARRKAEEEREVNLATEELLVELFNPPDNDSENTHSIIERAHRFIKAQPCTCTPEMIENWDCCPRCEALGRRGNELIER